ncbi:MAG TPA: NAD(P)/FAD-dependent oxidoreductase [Chitinophagales bacterium]|nr:NAD(P)/FAD-dependent oxidoreductase [Chitinophagales bacterium]
MQKNIIVIGGGAAGFFAAINTAALHPGYNVQVLEKSSSFLSKVKVSGGGRCNVTHACFDVKQLVKNYPRGEKQLLGPFTRFGPASTLNWFAERGVKLKTEPDGRMFPVTDLSQTIINCFLNETHKHHVKLLTHQGVEALLPPSQSNPQWQITATGGRHHFADAVIVTTGSGSGMWKLLEKLGHKITPPVPSLFTFNINDSTLKGLEGLSVASATVRIPGIKNLAATGPVLITHWGLSGPAILRLSAWGARHLAAPKYQFEVEINWAGTGRAEVLETLKALKQNSPRKNLATNPQFGIPKRLWERLVQNTGINYADLSNKQIEELTNRLAACRFAVNGRSTFKDEFVTAGGIDLNEVDFKTMQSRKLPGLYFAGEVLDVDAITGGFNFQCAWTTAWLAANAV